MAVVYVCQKKQEEKAKEGKYEKLSKGVSEKKKLADIREECEREWVNSTQLESICEDIMKCDSKLDKTNFELERIHRNWKRLELEITTKKIAEVREGLEKKCLEIINNENRSFTPQVLSVWWIPLEILVTLSESDKSNISAQQVRKFCQQLVLMFPERSLAWIRISSFQMKQNAIDKIIELVAPGKEAENEDAEDVEDEGRETKDFTLQAIDFVNANLLSFQDSMEGWVTLSALHLSKLDASTPSASKAFRYHVSYAQQCAARALTLLELREKRLGTKLNALRRELLLIDAGSITSALWRNCMASSCS